MTKQIIGSFEAKTHFSEIIHKVSEEHVEYVITKRGKPVAYITPYDVKRYKDTIEAIKEFSEYKKRHNLTLNKGNKRLRDLAHEEHKF